MSKNRSVLFVVRVKCQKKLIVKKKRNVKKIEKIVHPQMTAQDVGKDIFLNVEIKEKVFFHAKNIVR